MDKERIEDIILKYLSGEFSQKEENELIAWSKLSDKNFDYLQKVKHVWLISSQLRTKPKFDPESALKEFHLRIEEVEASHGTVQNIIQLEPHNRNFWKVFRYAVGILLILFAGGLISVFFQDKHWKSTIAQTSHFEIPIGSKGSVVLPDGTKVWLNAGSKLTYATDYNLQSRNVELEGEGFFEVVTNPKKPFVVNARNLAIKAYGTAFNVKAYSDEKTVETTLVKGKVFIEGKDRQNNNFVLEMKPKQSVIYYTEYENAENVTEHQADKNKLAHENPAAEQAEKNLGVSGIQLVKLDKVKTELYTSWKDSRWIIENEQLPDLIKKLERRFNVTFILLSKKQELQKYHFSGTIQNESIEQVLTILRFTLPVKYHINKDQIELRMDPELNTKYIKAL